MALTKCSECDGQVSADALTCPNCGHSLTGAIPQAPSMRQGDSAEVNEDEYLLEVFVRSNWFDHYQDRFMRFLHEDRPVKSWNWAAFFVPGWFLYRKLNAWFFAFVTLSLIISVAHVGLFRSPLVLLVAVSFFALPVLQGMFSVWMVAGGSPLALLGALAFFAVPVLQGMYGDYLLYRHGRSVINHARATVADPDTARRVVSDFGGTSNVSLAFLLVPMAGVWMLLFASMMIPKSLNEETMYVAAMKSDLRNMVTAQEYYFTEFSTYTTKAGLGTSYSESPGVTVTTANVSETGWQATASHTGTTETCIIYIGAAAPSTSTEGAPHCN